MVGPKATQWTPEIEANFFSGNKMEIFGSGRGGWTSGGYLTDHLAKDG